MILDQDGYKIMKCDRCGKQVAKYKDPHKPKQPLILCSDCIIPYHEETQGVNQ